MCTYANRSQSYEIFGLSIIHSSNLVLTENFENNCRTIKNFELSLQL